MLNQWRTTRQNIPANLHPLLFGGAGSNIPILSGGGAAKAASGLVFPTDHTGHWIPDHCTEAVDTAHPHFPSGQGNPLSTVALAGLKLTGNTGHTDVTISQTGLALDLTNTWAMLHFYVDPAQAAAFNCIRLYLGDGAAWHLTYSGYKAADPPAPNTGWRRICIPLVSFDGGTDANLAAITTLKINPVWQEANSGHFVTIAGLEFVPKPTKKYMVIRIDDGYAATKQWAGYCTEKGLRCCIGVCPGMTTLTTAETRRLRDAGHFIHNHGYTAHGGAEQWDQWTLARRISETLDGAAWLASIGCGAGARYLTTPGGALRMVDGEDQDEIIGQYLSLINATNWSADGGTLIKRQWNHPMCLPYLANTANDGGYVLATSRLGEFVGAGGTAGADGGIFQFMTHCATTYATFATFVDLVATYVAGNGLEVVTYPELMGAV